MMKRMGIGILVFGFVLAMGTAAQAVPALGVAGGEPVASSGCSDNYWECFDSNLGGHAFALPASGGTVTVWVDLNRVDDTDDIYLVAENSFQLTSFSTFSTVINPATDGDKKLTGYTDFPEYTAINLTTFPSSPWSPLTVGEFSSGNFVSLSGTLNYDGDSTGAWLFVVSDNPDGILGTHGDIISPKTTSAVPEPGTLILLGSGLVGLGLYRRKFKS